MRLSLCPSVICQLSVGLGDWQNFALQEWRGWSSSQIWHQTAIGQFDLASTYETERGILLDGPKDNHPEIGDDVKGAKVIQKYNRHWAMVMHPEDATAGSNLMQVAR